MESVRRANELPLEIPSIRGHTPPVSNTCGLAVDFHNTPNHNIKMAGVPRAKQGYEYDPLSRLHRVSSDELLAEIGYVDGTGILKQQTVKTKPGGQTIHERRLAIDMLGRTEGVQNLTPSAGLAQVSFRTQEFRFFQGEFGSFD